MDKTDATPSAAGPARASDTPRRGSQSKLSPVLLWILLAAVLFRIVTSVTNRSPEEETLVRWVPAASAAAASRTQGRPILYDFTAEWCGPCKILDRDGWNDPDVSGFVNARFVPARVLDRQREEGRNAPDVSALQRKYGVRAFPTLVVAAADGRELAKTEGFGGREALRKFLQDALARASSPGGSP